MSGDLCGVARDYGSVSVGTAGAATGLDPARPGLAGLGWPQSMYSGPQCAGAADFHLVRIQCNIAEQDNIDLQSHILGRVVWLLSQDNRVE